MNDTWFQADTLRQQIRKLGLKDSEEFAPITPEGYAEVEIVVETIGPADQENTDNELDSLLD